MQTPSCALHVGFLLFGKLEGQFNQYKPGKEKRRDPSCSLKNVLSTLLPLRERIRMFQGEKLEDGRLNKPIPLSLQWMRRKGRRKEGQAQLLSVVPSGEKERT